MLGSRTRQAMPRTQWKLHATMLVLCLTEAVRQLLLIQSYQRHPSLTELLHSEKLITKFSRVALKLIWFIYLNLGSPYRSWTHGWLLGLMGWSLRHLKLGMPSCNHFLHQSLDGWVRVCDCGGHLLKQVLIAQTLDVRRHRCKYIQLSYTANKL